MVEKTEDLDSLYQDLINIFVENKKLAKKNAMDIEIFLRSPDLMSKGINEDALKSYCEKNQSKVTLEEDLDNKSSKIITTLVFKEKDQISKVSPFDYLLVLDFEAQCSETDKLILQEIIEFPVLIVNTRTLKVEEKYFHQYLKPEIHPELFPFCTELTGIKQSQVDEGIKLSEALVKLEDFLKENGIFNKRFTFVTCGFWDLNTCLKTELKYKKMTCADYMKEYINLKQVYADEFLKNGESFKRLGMPTMLSKLSLTLDGHHHSGIDDCRNIAKIVIALLQKGLCFNRKYVNYVKY